MTITLAVVAIVAIVVFVAWMVRRDARLQAKQLEEAFVGRESLTPQAFYDRYFLGLGIAPEVVFGIRQILEEQLGADLSRLQAEDDFSRNLSFFWDWDSLADVEILVAIEERFQIKISDAEAEKTHTVLELVQLVADKVVD